MASSPLLPPSSFPLSRQSIRSEDGRTVIGPALGTTFYLADPFFWAERGVVDALQLFVEGPWRGRLAYYTTSLLDRWRPLDGGLRDVLAALTREKLLVRGPRPFFSFSVADDPHVPSTAFTYTEVDPRRSDRTSVLELTLAATDPPAWLREVSLRTAALGAFYSGVGGFVARFNPLFRRLAFNQFFLWARRFVGLDVQIPDDSSWSAAFALQGSSWLNFLGAPWAERREVDLVAWRTQTWRAPGVTCTGIRPHAADRSVLLQAGESPTLGDRNDLVWPAAYAEVARALVDFFPEDPPTFWGAFAEHELTEAWMRRLVVPKEWT